MSIKKRACLAFLAAVMTLSLVACSSNGASNGTQNQSGTEQTQTQTQAPAKTEAPAATVETVAEPAAEPSEFEGIVGLSKYESPVIVTTARSADPNVRFAPGQDYTHNIWITEYADILGIDLRTAWTAEGSQSYDEKLQLQILANDLPDVFQCNAAQFASMVSGNMLTDLTDVLTQYQTDLVKENLQGDGGLGLEQASVNGRLYGIPSDRVGPGAYEFLFIREDWRQQLGLPEPKTVADVLTLAKAFKENDPDGMSAYGLGISNQPFETYFTARGFCDMFGAHPQQWVEKNGKLEYGLVQPEMKTALAAMASWYAEGLIDQEFVVRDSYTMSQEAIGGRVGVVVGEWWLTTWPLPDGYRLNQDWKAYWIPFDASNTEKRYSSVATLQGRYVVRNGFEHPEALVKMYNLFQERVMSGKYDVNIYKGDSEFNYDGLAAVYGVVGPDRNAAAHTNINNALSKKDPSLLTNPDEEEKYARITDYLNGTDKDDPDKYATNFMWYRAYYGDESIFGMMKQMDPNKNLALDEFYDNPTATMAETMSLLKSKAEEMINNIISGAESIDAFDTFVTDWYASGGQQITQEVNDWYANRK